MPAQGGGGWGWRPGSGDGGRLPWSWSSSQPASASDPGGWWGGGTRSCFLTILGAPAIHPDKQGRRSELGGVGWGGVARDPGPGARGIISQTSTKGRVVPARPTRRRPYAEQQ